MNQTKWEERPTGTWVELNRRGWDSGYYFSAPIKHWQFVGFLKINKRQEKIYVHGECLLINDQQIKRLLFWFIRIIFMLFLNQLYTIVAKNFRITEIDIQCLENITHWQLSRCQVKSRKTFLKSRNKLQQCINRLWVWLTRNHSDHDSNTGKRNSMWFINSNGWICLQIPHSRK